jgi:UDP-N-acetylmuramoyl-tripeptide--D-alanyl-D-alanine ligase
METRCATLAAVTDDRTSPPPRSAPSSPAGFHAAELARVTGGRLLRPSIRPIRGAAVDSRLVRPGELFVALPGERTDGHRFIADAAAAGAAAIMVTREPTAEALAALGDAAVILVSDGVAALGAAASAWRRRFSPTVVGVTGSIAKTSAKEAIATVLSETLLTLRNEANLNNEIGLPLTLLRLGPEHQAAVLEMGMYTGGEIADLARIAQPGIGVVTAVQGVHLSRIGTIGAVERAKGELVEALPSDGWAILNADDARVARMRARTRARVLTYGLGPGADIGATSIRSAGLDGMRFVLELPGARLPAAIPMLGRLSVHNALAAAAVGVSVGQPGEAIVAGLARGWSAPHRVAVVRLGDVTIVDDTYNASPGSVRAALELLCDLPGRRVAVLGEMLELGSESASGHLGVGEAAAAAAELLVVVGPGARGIAEGARAAGMAPTAVIECADRAAARSALFERLQPGDVVLVKASRGVELDVLVDSLAADLRTGGRA